jgi:hypothetical protein
MLKSLVFTTLVSISLFAQAEPVVVPGEAFLVPQVAAALEQKCAPDCIVMNRADWTEMLEKLQKAALEAAKNKNI